MTSHSLFELLEDGEWHGLSELAEALGIPLNELNETCRHVSKHNFIEYDVKAKKVKIGQKLLNLIKSLEKDVEVVWDRLAAGTLIIPPKKIFKIQDLTIQNETEYNLQIETTFDEKLREIVISKI